MLAALRTENVQDYLIIEKNKALVLGSHNNPALFCDTYDISLKKLLE